MLTVPLGPRSCSLLRICWVTFLGSIISLACLLVASAQTTSPIPQAPQALPPDTSRNTHKPDAQQPNDEIVSHDSPTTFKVRVNVVLARVVVRDTNGKVVPNLKKEDFQLADNRKLQNISSFSVETPASHVTTVKMDSAEAPTEGTPVKTPEIPQRFVTLYFDDLHISPEDNMLSRQAAIRIVDVMRNGERLAILTTSGLVSQDFTSDREKLDEALQRIASHQPAQSLQTECPPMSFYEAYKIVDEHDAEALQMAMSAAANCTGQRAVLNLVESKAQTVLSVGETQIQITFSNLEALIRRMSALPGERVIVLMSPGFFVTPSMQQSGDIIDRATKANVVINTIDARGLYVSSFYDAAKAAPGPSAFSSTEEMLQNDILDVLADGTGGTFFHNRNDIDQGLLQAAAEPEVSYVLGFTPQNLKLDGRYHHLKVTLTNKQKWELQARHGYFAPHGESDPESTAKEEIQQAIFSQEELRDLTIECQTQFSKGTSGARLAVVAHVDTKGLKFRKAEDRNDDKLTVSTVIFDGNGNLITGLQRIIDLRLKDATLDRVQKTGLSFKSSFDLQPGTFLVRIVVRDSEGAQMAAVNRGVVIP